MLLSQLLAYPLPPDYDCHCSGLNVDSRLIKPGDVFCALVGTQVRGESYIPTALQRGAVAILKEAHEFRLEKWQHQIPCLTIPQLSQQLGHIAARFYQQPSRNMRIVGVTGTNGKTTISHLITQILHKSSMPCGLIGTLGYGLYGALQPSLHTTPQPIDLQLLFSQLKAQNVRCVAMEVSSHALAQGRVNGVNFDTAVFTNLSRDHLDYHHSMENYFAAKLLLFQTNGLKTAVLNGDDEAGIKIKQQLPTSVNSLSYSIKNTTAEIYAEIQSVTPQGCHLFVHTPWGKGQLYSPLLGKFNVSNILAVIAVLLNWNFPLTKLLTIFSDIIPISGRMEKISKMGQPTAIVDYAHTPDALQQTLSALREHCHINSAQLWCVFGCGGNRDQGKRALMGRIAQSYADRIVITDDNPRHEDSKAIINDILQGCLQPEQVIVITDRKQAIEYALQNAHSQDIVLIAGKGHETYQQIGEQRFPFSDRHIVNTHFTILN